MLAKHCLQEFKLDCHLRKLSERTIKGYYNNTLNFLIYAEKHHGITEVEEIYTLHIKHCPYILEQFIIRGPALIREFHPVGALDF